MATYTATELTLEQRSALVDKLCSTPEVVLKKLKKDELIALAAGIVSYYKKLSKLELLDELLKIRTSELVQKEAIAIAAQASEEERKARLEANGDDLGVRIAMYQKELKNIAYTTQDVETRLERSAAFAAKSFMQLSSVYADSSIAKYLGHIKKTLEHDPADSALEQTTAMFVRTLFTSFKERAILNNAASVAKVKAKMANNPRVNATALIAYATNVLKQQKAGIEQTYQDLAIALIMLTGRRPIEVCYVGIFEADSTDNRKLYFKGQAKGKHNTADKNEKLYLVPTLADSDLILFGKACLDNKLKLRGSQPQGEGVAFSKSFNDIYSKPLNRAIGIWRSVGECSDLTPKSMRAVYANYCADNFNKGSVNSRAVYLADILGHEPNDPLTFQSYQCYEVY